MENFEWDKEKNERLKLERGITFEDVVFYISNGCLLDTIPHPNENKYPDQKIIIINIDNYAFLVPFIETDYVIFLKTIIPSRKATKDFLKEKEGLK